MRLTKTTNSSMARFTAMDPSDLSRLRRGEEAFHPGAPYLGRMAIYFARHCREELDTNVGRTGQDFSGKDGRPELLADAIENWLYQESRQGACCGKILEGI